MLRTLRPLLATALLCSCYVGLTVGLTVGFTVGVTACGEDPVPDPSPYAELPSAMTVPTVGLDGPIDVVRDRFGVPHIWATTVLDAGFANGYVLAADRAAQMDLFRHFATGTVAELFGALEPEQIDSDLEMRLHRMKQRADATVVTLNASADPLDQELARYLQRFADGVNACVLEISLGTRQIDPSVAVWFDAGRFAHWTPSDSIAIGLLQSWFLSYDVEEIDHTDKAQRARAAFDLAPPGPHARRAGAFADLYSYVPMDATPTIAGFPNVGMDTGTRAKPSRTPAGPRPPAVQRPHVAAQLLAQAAATLRPRSLGGMMFRHPEDGSNNWVLGPALTGGMPIVANDPHLSLSSPSVFYLLHLTVPGKLDVEGISFPGIPGVILGHNEHLAWGSTTVSHDVTDVYVETIVPCAAGGGDCALHDGGEVPLESWTETIKVGALGTITEQFDVTYERVPHHGPIIPTIVAHRLAPRAAGQALSVRYAGYEPTFEVRALYRLNRAQTVAEGFDALDDFGHGGQNWVLADDTGAIGWTSASLLPLRTAGCYTWHPTDNPGGVAPFFVVPGDGSCEWDGWMDPRYVPHAVDPPSGFLVTANADPVGQVFDGNPLNDGVDEAGHILYAGASYDVGYRTGRITRGLEELIAAGPVTLDGVARVQGDARSNHGEKMRPHLLAAMAAYHEETAAAGTHADLGAWVAALPEARRARLEAAAMRLAAWTLDTPAAVLGQPSADEIADSAATVIWNAFMVFFLDRAFGDELEQLGRGVDSARTARVGRQVFEDPAGLATGIAVETGEALLCDELNTPLIESCKLVALKSFDAALSWAEGIHGTADLDQWRWGRLHTLTLTAQIPADELNVPQPDDGPDFENGYPRHGDQFAVDASSAGYNDLFFAYSHGPAMRNLMQIEGPGRIVTRMALPGGEIYDRGTGHFRDLFDEYWAVNEYFALPYTTAEVTAEFEARWRLSPVAIVPH